MNARNGDKENSAMGLAGALYGASTAAPQAAAADAMCRGMDLLLGEAQRLINLNVEFKKGNLFEFIEAAKFNTNAALKGSGIRAEVAAANGDPTGPADILIWGQGAVVAQVQAKVSRSSTHITRALSDEKYEGMYKLVPQDKAEPVRQLAHGLAERTGQRGEPIARQYSDTARSVRGDLQVDDVRSGGTDLDETLEAAQQPSRYAFRMKADAVVDEALVAGGRAALASGILGGAISLVRNGIAIAREEVSGRGATIQVVQDTARAAVRGGANASLGTVIRHTTKLPGLTKANVATAIASGLIDAGVSVYAYIKGELAPDELAHALGQNGCSTLSGLYGGAIAGAAFGPVGALLGSAAGYLVAANIYQSSIAILQHARLVEVEAARAIALREEARQSLVAHQTEVERWLQERLEDRDQTFQQTFAAIDAGLTNRNPEQAVAGMSELTALFGQQLSFVTFKEFDEFMMNSDEPLRL